MIGGQMTLTTIKGIGPAAEQKLNKIGINTIEDIIDNKDNEIVKESWVTQALELVEEPIAEEIAPVETPDFNSVIKVISGDHKGKMFTWKSGSPVLVMTGSGRYISLGSISTDKIETVDGVVKFKFIWESSISGATMPEEEYSFFEAEAKKKHQN